MGRAIVNTTAIYKLDNFLQMDNKILFIMATIAYTALAATIIINHVMASGTLPLLYKFREIPTKAGRKLCDGGILSNTPFRELLQAHRDYWKRVIGEGQDKIPDLDVYIINVHPSKQDTLPTDDRDAVQDRINDITFSDGNSHYDEMAADLVTDYTQLIDNLKELAKSHFGIIG
jgi:NTE family protein